MERELTSLLGVHALLQLAHHQEKVRQEAKDSRHWENAPVFEEFTRTRLVRPYYEHWEREQARQQQQRENAAARRGHLAVVKDSDEFTELADAVRRWVETTRPTVGRAA